MNDPEEFQDDECDHRHIHTVWEVTREGAPAEDDGRIVELTLCVREIDDEKGFVALPIPPDIWQIFRLSVGSTCAVGGNYPLIDLDVFGDAAGLKKLGHLRCLSHASLMNL